MGDDNTKQFNIEVRTKAELAALDATKQKLGEVTGEVGKQAVELKRLATGAKEGAEPFDAVAEAAKNAKVAVEQVTEAEDTRQKRKAADVVGGPGSTGRTAAAEAEEEAAALEHKREIVTSLVAAVHLEAEGRIEEANALRAEVDLMRLADKFQKELNVDAAQAALLARDATASAAKAAELKMAEAAAARAAALAEEEQALAAKAAAKAEKEAAAAAALMAREAKAAEMAHVRMAQTVQSVGLRHLGLGRAGGVEARGLENMLGIGAGGVAAVAGVSLAVAGVIAFADASHKADEELRKMTRSSDQAAEKLRENLGVNPQSVMEHTRSELQKLGNELEDIDHKFTGAKIWNGLKEGVGISGDSQSISENFRERLRLMLLQRDAGYEIRADIHSQLEITEALLNGQTALAEEKAQELKNTREIAKITAETNGNPLQNDIIEATKRRQAEDALLKKQTEENKQREAGEKALAAESDKILQKNLEIADKLKEQTAQMQEQAGIENLIADGKDDEATALKLQIALGKEWLAIQDKLAKGEIDQATASDAQAAALDKYNAALGVLEKKKWDAYQTEQDRIKAEEQKAADEEARQKESDDARMQAMQDRTAELRQQLAGETLAAKNAEVDLKLNRELAMIAKSMAPERRAEAVAIANANAELEKQLNLQKKINKEAGQALKDFNDKTDAAIRKRNQSPQEAADERRAEQKQRHDERTAMLHDLAHEENDQANKGHRMTQEEQEQFKKDWQAARGTKTKPSEDPAALADKVAHPAGSGEHPMIPKRSAFLKRSDKHFDDDTPPDAEEPLGSPMSEADIAGDSGVPDAGGGNGIGSAISDAAEKAKSAARDAAKSLADSIKGVDWDIKLDTSSIADAVQSKVDGVRDDLQSQIDALSAQLSSDA